MAVLQRRGGWEKAGKIARENGNKYFGRAGDAGDFRALAGSTRGSQTPITPSPSSTADHPCSRPASATTVLTHFRIVTGSSGAHSSRWRPLRARAPQARPHSRQTRRPHPIEMPSTSTVSPPSRFSSRPKVSTALLISVQGCRPWWEAEGQRMAQESP